MMKIYNEIQAHLAKLAREDFDIECPSSFTDYCGKRTVELKKFWNILYDSYGIQTYKEGEHWIDVVLSQMSEKSLKQKLTYYCKYGVLNPPRGFKQVLDIAMRDNNINKIYVLPVDNKYRADSFDYCFEELKNFILLDKDANKINVTEQEYEEMINR